MPRAGMLNLALRCSGPLKWTAGSPAREVTAPVWPGAGNAVVGPAEVTAIATATTAMVGIEKRIAPPYPTTDIARPHVSRRAPSLTSPRLAGLSNVVTLHARAAYAVAEVDDQAEG